MTFSVVCCLYMWYEMEICSPLLGSGHHVGLPLAAPKISSLGSVFYVVWSNIAKFLVFLEVLSKVFCVKCNVKFWPYKTRKSLSMSLIHKIKQHNLLAEFWCKHMQHYTLFVNIKSIIYKQQNRIQLTVWRGQEPFSMLYQTANEDLSKSTEDWQNPRDASQTQTVYAAIYVKLQFMWLKRDVEACKPINDHSTGQCLSCCKDLLCFIKTQTPLKDCQKSCQWQKTVKIHNVQLTVWHYLQNEMLHKSPRPSNSFWHLLGFPYK